MCAESLFSSICRYCYDTTGAFTQIEEVAVIMYLRCRLHCAAAGSYRTLEASFFHFSEPGTQDRSVHVAEVQR